MKVTSAAFSHYGMIPQRYTCDGEDICPPLEIWDPPNGTKSFTILMHDHDAQSEDFAHWLIWNIDQKVRKIEEETTPIGAVEGTNDFGRTRWGGPCPPSGKHHYEFHVYALNTMLDLPITTTKVGLRRAIQRHIIEEASIVGLYETL